MTMTCPRCRTGLTAERHPAGIAWRCPGCGGQSLNFSQFRRLVPEPEANGIWESAMLHPRAPRRRALCPECERDMAAVLIPVRDRELELDVCRSCQRLWLDRQESLAGQLQDATAAGPQPEPRPVPPEARDRAAGGFARKVFRSRPSVVFDVIGRLTVIGVLLYIIYRMILKIVRFM
jgi:Zn-finger nucleic acid-binding protein